MLKDGVSKFNDNADLSPTDGRENGAATVKLEHIQSNDLSLSSSSSSSFSSSSSSSSSTLLDRDNSQNIVRVSFDDYEKEIPCFQLYQQCEHQQKNYFNSDNNGGAAMVQCATVVEPPPDFNTATKAESPFAFPRQATTMPTGSCFIVLCNACSEQCSRTPRACFFLRVHGREGNSNSTSSIEIDISDQGNFVVGESFFFKFRQNSGHSRVHPRAVKNNNCNSDGISEECECELFDKIKCENFPLNEKKILSHVHITHGDGKFCESVSAYLTKELNKESGVSMKSNVIPRNYSFPENGECLVFECGRDKLNELKIVGLQKNLKQKQSLQQFFEEKKKNQVENRKNVVVSNGSSRNYVRKTTKELTADFREENQCELGVSGVFEASHRLKRLEEHFKGLACTKKLSDSNDVSQSTYYEDEIGNDGNSVSSNYLNKIHNKNQCKPFTLPSLEIVSSSKDILLFLPLNETEIKRNFKKNPVRSCETSEHSKISPPFSYINITNDNTFLNVSPVQTNTNASSSSGVKVLNACNQNKGLFLISSVKYPRVGLVRGTNSVNENEIGDNCQRINESQTSSSSETRIFSTGDSSTPIVDSLPDLLSSANVCNSNSEFDVRYLNQFTVDYALECYYEFDSNSSVSSAEEENNENLPCEFFTKEGISFFEPQKKPSKIFAATMRELNGPLRGLLKKPNRPPQARKNRVVFDETRNEFFDADYIILIREDCTYDEEDEEPCTCGEHELIRLCCEEGCQCNYSEENRTPQSPKFAPPMEFVDDAALSPPEGYKDNGLKNAISGALSGHVFGAQHIQQLQVIQKLQQQRAAMLAAHASKQHQQQVPQTPASVSTEEEEDQSTVCTECAECVECAAKQMQDVGHLEEELPQLSVPTVALIPLHNNSPERRVTQKEIIAGEERPKYILSNQHKSAPEEETEKIVSVHKNQRYVVETITMTTVTERRIVREATEDITTVTSSTIGIGAVSGGGTRSSSNNSGTVDPPPEPTSVEHHKPEQQGNISASQISGILKGGKLWKHEQSQVEDSNNTSSEEDSNLKRSVRFVTEANTEISREGDGKADTENSEADNPINELIPFKKHSTLFNNALRPNSALRQLFPSVTHPPLPAAAVLTHETLRAFDESKRGNPLMSSLLTPSTESDTIRRTIERNALRRSLIKKKATKSDISLEERIKQLTCNIEESTEDVSIDNSEDNEKGSDVLAIERRDSPTGEENPSQVKYLPDKSFSPSSSASSSSSGSTSAYKKISNVFNREKRQEKIPETDENPIVIIPQECRCPAAPDLGMGVQVPAAHTQIHQTPPRQTEPRRQFLSTLAPLTACVAGQKDDFSYYTLAASERNSNASTQCSEYNLGDAEPSSVSNESRKVAPDVIAGTPGQEQDELAAFASQEAIRTEKIKKRYSNESSSVPHSNASSDDDEQNDYGFNKRPSVRGIKPKFSSTNEIIQQMQAQLSQPMTPQNTAKTNYTVAKQPCVNKVQQATIAQHQSERSWSLYASAAAEQRLGGTETINQHSNYYQAIPTAIKHTFHGHEESLTYQNCHSITMEQHYGRFARSPTRRPESPPPLRNYHQTMVLIPYNTESYAQFAAQDPKTAQQFSRHNILEYQQVTQQTIRVPISYTVPGMQLQVVAGRGSQPQYLHQPRVVAPRSYSNFQQHQQNNSNTMIYCERGVPEGAAATTHSDCKNLMSPTGSQQSNQQQQHQQQQNCTTQTNNPSSVPETMFYAMNV